MTIDEAEKFNDFLKHQRWQLDQAASKVQDEEWKSKEGGYNNGVKPTY